ANLVAPAECAIEVTMHGIAVLDVGVAHRIGLRALEFHVPIGAESLQDDIEALIRPLQLSPQTVDRHPGWALADMVVGGPELPTQGRRGYQPGQLLLLVEPGAQRLTDGGGAGGFHPSSGFPPVEIAIETLHKFIGEADTHNLRGVLRSSRHVSLS